MELNFSMGCIIGEIGNDESDPQHSLHEGLKKILSDYPMKKQGLDTKFQLIMLFNAFNLESGFKLSM